MTHRILAGKQVLVVENEMMLLLMIEGMLEEMGCRSVSAAATFKQALRLIEVETFDVAMLDLNLNGDRSYAVADALKALDVPFMFSTGYGLEGVAAGYRKQPLLMKPYTFPALVGALNRLLDGDRLLPEAA